MELLTDISNHHFKTLLPLRELVTVINDMCAELSVYAIFKNVQPNWECSCNIRGAACSFVINMWEYEDEIVINFTRMNGSRYVFSEILKGIYQTLSGVQKNNQVTLPRVETYSPSEEELSKTATYICELISIREMCLNGLLVLSNVLNEKLVWHLGKIYDTIIEKGHSDDEEIAVAAIVCLNEYVNYLVFTEELSHRMCSIVERCSETNPYHVKREALKFAVTLSLKVPSQVRETGILTFARPNKKDLITFQYVSRLTDVLNSLN